MNMIDLKPLYRKKQEKGRLEAKWRGNWENDATSGKSVLSIHNLQLHSAVFTRLIMHPGLVQSIHNLQLHSSVFTRLINDASRV